MNQLQRKEGEVFIEKNAIDYIGYQGPKADQLQQAYILSVAQPWSAVYCLLPVSYRSRQDAIEQ